MNQLEILPSSDLDLDQQSRIRDRLIPQSVRAMNRYQRLHGQLYM